MAAVRKALSNISLFVGLLGAGDVICQQLEQKSANNNDDAIKTVDKWNPKRTATIAAGGIPTAILVHFWYGFLDRRLPGITKRTIFKKVLADQTICAPFFYLTFFICNLLLFVDQTA